MSYRSFAVFVGHVGVGGDNPLRIQSMTTTPTHEVQASVDQILKLADHGCEIVRLTVQGMKEALSCEQIKNTLEKRGCLIPLVADIHFYPPAAMTVADFVDKVRINPGNFVDRRATFKTVHYTEKEYQEELCKIEEAFSPLVLKCKGQKKALRIGVNHGSLSDRIMTRYGNTEEGMVESAIEFARIAKKLAFEEMIFSMKASNPLVMIRAYRLLVAKMEELGWNYPLHLGVTEAGAHEDGRIRSAVGIGALLLDGIGDTIRVSLTEDPWHEIAPAKELIALVSDCKNPRSDLPADFTARQGVEREGNLNESWRARAHCPAAKDAAKMNADFCNQTLAQHRQTPTLFFPPPKRNVTYKPDTPLHPQGSVLLEKGGDSTPAKPDGARYKPDAWLDEIKTLTIQSKEDWPLCIRSDADALLFAPKNNRLEEGRAFFAYLHHHRILTPVILSFAYKGPYEQALIRASAECGALLADGLGEGIALSLPLSNETTCALSYSLLQACRMRLTKTEFISCPGCGRTLFNLQEVSERIRAKTGHLSGVKIAIMGCIVNGPGEMADADFGYVGSAHGKIDLYVGKERVEKNIPAAEAEERLIALIKAHGRWQ